MAIVRSVRDQGGHVPASSRAASTFSSTACPDVENCTILTPGWVIRVSTKGDDVWPGESRPRGWMGVGALETRRANLGPDTFNSGEFMDVCIHVTSVLLSIRKPRIAIDEVDTTTE